jgi:hypothetical protein
MKIQVVWEIGLQTGIVSGVLKELAASIFRALQEQGLDFSGDGDSTESTLMMDTASSSENSVTIHRTIKRHLTTLESSYALLFIDVSHRLCFP